jgi:nitrate/nitrite transporter NarK
MVGARAVLILLAIGSIIGAAIAVSDSQHLSAVVFIVVTLIWISGLVLSFRYSGRSAEDYREQPQETTKKIVLGLWATAFVLAIVGILGVLAAFDPHISTFSVSQAGRVAVCCFLVPVCLPHVYEQSERSRKREIRSRDPPARTATSKVPLSRRCHRGNLTSSSSAGW